MRRTKEIVRDEKGQDIVEYTLLLAAMALATGAVILPMQSQVSTIWTGTCNLMSSAAAGN
jgi:Flp pilus assembly pilin Flp